MYTKEQIEHQKRHIRELEYQLESVLNAEGESFVTRRIESNIKEARKVLENMEKHMKDSMDILAMVGITVDSCSPVYTKGEAEDDDATKEGAIKEYGKDTDPTVEADIKYAVNMISRAASNLQSYISNPKVLVRQAQDIKSFCDDLIRSANKF